MLVQSRSKACATCQTRKIKVWPHRAEFPTLVLILAPNSVIERHQHVLSALRMVGHVQAMPRHGKNEKGQPGSNNVCQVLPQNESLVDQVEDEQQWLPSSGTLVKATNPRHAKIILNAASYPKISLCPPHLLGEEAALQLAKQVIAHLEDKKPPGIDIRNLGHFFDFIPSRVGQSDALDDAVKCILTAYSACLYENGAALSQDRAEYYRALTSLRIACLDEKEVLSDDTLCAAVLLSWYEV